MQESSAANLLGTVTTLVQDTQVDVTRLIYMLYQDIEHQINRADMKAQITLSTASILMTVLVRIGIGFDPGQFPNLPISRLSVLFLYLFFLAAMFASFARGIAAAFPRAVRKLSVVDRHPNLYFSAQIVAIPGDDYADLFCNQSNDGVKRSVLGQIHSKSLVLEAKLYNVRQSMIFLLVGMALWIIARIVLLTAGQGA